MPTFPLKITANECRALQEIDPGLSLPIIIRGLLDDDTPARACEQQASVSGRLHLELEQETIDRLEREADQDLDYELQDYIRVRLLDLEPLLARAIEPVEPMVIEGRFKLDPLSPLVEKLWIPVPGGITPRRSLRRWLSPLRISERRDEPAVVTISERSGRACSMWLTARELARVRDAAAGEGASVVEFISRVIFGNPVPCEQRLEVAA